MPLIKETDTTLDSYIVTQRSAEERALRQAAREREVETVISRHPTRRVRLWGSDEPDDAVESA